MRFDQNMKNTIPVYLLRGWIVKCPVQREIFVIACHPTHPLDLVKPTTYQVWCDLNRSYVRVFRMTLKKGGPLILLFSTSFWVDDRYGPLDEII